MGLDLYLLSSELPYLTKSFAEASQVINLNGTTKIKLVVQISNPSVSLKKAASLKNHSALCDDLKVITYKDFKASNLKHVFLA